MGPLERREVSPDLHSSPLGGSGRGTQETAKRAKHIIISMLAITIIAWKMLCNEMVQGR